MPCKNLERFLSFGSDARREVARRGDLGDHTSHFGFVADHLLSFLHTTKLRVITICIISLCCICPGLHISSGPVHTVH